MACPDCDKSAQKRFFDVYWFRWGAANMGIIGCRKDVTEVLNARRKAQEERR